MTTKKSPELAAFEVAVQDHAKYPNSLLNPDIYPHTLEKYVECLELESERLFCDENDAQLILRELRPQQQEFCTVCTHNTHELKYELEHHFAAGLTDPLCRFVFISAPHALEQLYVSRSMFSYVLTYLQVMAGFLDFVFPFGERENPQDFQFSGFRSSSRLSPPDQGHAIPELLRSGHIMEMCFNLKSVEISEGKLTEAKWSFRQASVYHCFDVRHGQTKWIIIKGNDLLERRLVPETENGKSSAPKRYGSVAGALAASLEVHLILCDWANEDWRWYIKGLEDRCQQMSEIALATKIRKRTSTHRNASEWDEFDRVKPFKTILSEPWNKLQRTFSTKPPKAKSMPTSNGALDAPKIVRKEFAFEDVQRLHYLEEQAQKTILALKANVDVMLDLLQNYTDLVDSEYFNTTNNLSQECRPPFERFARRLKSLVREQEAMKARAEALLQLIIDRRSLLHAILEFRNMEASLELAEKSRASSDKMERLTAEMHRVAKKTEEETVSMKVITVVTLFFLPGTFISTLMSTDIIRYQEDENGVMQKQYSGAALSLYLKISLPLMFITSLAYICIYVYATRQENLKGMRRRMKALTEKV